MSIEKSINHIVLTVAAICICVGIGIAISQSFILPKSQYECTSRPAPGDEIDDGCKQYTRKVAR